MRAVPSGRLCGALVCVSLMAAGMSGAAFAAEGAIEEIVVTARLREESLQDSPIAVTAMSGESLDRMNLANLEDIAQTTPSLYLNPGRSDGLFIRGIGSGGDTGFDQSVGIVIDDVPFSRGRWLTQAYFDVNQIEVLKGPQGVYLGKNATAGAVYITTRGPGDEREINARVGHEFEAKETFGEFIASGPVSDTVGVRVALRMTDQDGWFENIEEDENEPNPKDLAGRITVSWDVNDSVTNVLKIGASDVEQDTINSGAQKGFCPGGAAQPVFGIVPSPNENCRVDDESTLDSNAPDDYGSGRWWDYQSWTMTNRLEWDLGDYVITSITGISNYQVDYQDDYDYNSAPVIYAFEEEENDQWNQEFRIATRWDGPINLLAGVSYEETDFTFRNSSVLFNQTVLDVFAFLAGLPPGSFPLVDPETGRSFLWDRQNSQDGKSFAGYAELQWEINQDWRLDVGGRYTKVEKESESNNTYVHPIQGLFFGLAPVDRIYSDDYDDDDLAPQVTLSWFPAEDMMVFASYTEAFKAGGFAHGSTLTAATTVDQVTFDAESAEGYNLGIKTDLFDQRLNLSAIAFYNEFTDLQQSVFDSASTSFVVANAGENVTQGVDLNANWMIDDNWTATAAVTYLDTEIKDFLGACFAGQTIEQGCNQVLNTATGRFSSRDLDGSQLPTAADWQANAGLAYRTVIANGFEFTATTNMLYVDDRIYNEQRGYVGPSYTRWDMSLGVASPDGHWLAQFYGKNLTDEEIIAGAIDSPGTGGNAGLPASDPAAGRWADGVSTILRTRELGLSVTWRM
jgi:iron complex outermembrane receptor protein